jgi:hypothetical protein
MAQVKTKKQPPRDTNYPKVIYVYRGGKFHPVTVADKEEEAKFKNWVSIPTKEKLAEFVAKDKPAQ